MANRFKGYCFPYSSAPVPGELLHSQLVSLVQTDDDDIGRVDRNRLFFVVGLGGLGTFDVKAALF